MAKQTNPSLASGLATIRRSPRLIVAVWFVPALLIGQFILAIQTAYSSALGKLPAVAAPGDPTLILMATTGRLGRVVMLSALVAAVGTWLWTVLWHAGLVTWRVWAADRPQRLGELIGHGVMRWWRYLRLALVASVASLVLLVAVTQGFGAAARRVGETLREAAAMRITLAGGAVAIILVLFLWAGTLRALWELAETGRRSAVLAWLRGLGGALRHPLVSLGVLLAWVVPALILWIAAFFGARALGAIGGGLPAYLVLQVGALLRAVAWVGLVGSFAPIVGLAVRPALEKPVRTRESESARVAAAG